MGYRFADQYSLLHFASGVIAYFFGLSFIEWFILHAIFEIVENTPQGIMFINTYLTFWPGGKPRADKTINSIGDQFFSLIGWIAAFILDRIGIYKEWYNPKWDNYD